MGHTDRQRDRVISSCLIHVLHLCGETLRTQQRMLAMFCLHERWMPVHNLFHRLLKRISEIESVKTERTLNAQRHTVGDRQNSQVLPMASYSTSQHRRRRSKSITTVSVSRRTPSLRRRRLMSHLSPMIDRVLDLSLSGKGDDV